MPHPKLFCCRAFAQRNITPHNEMHITFEAATAAAVSCKTSYHIDFITSADSADIYNSSYYSRINRRCREMKVKKQTMTNLIFNRFMLLHRSRFLGIEARTSVLSVVKCKYIDSSTAVQILFVLNWRKSKYFHNDFIFNAKPFHLFSNSDVRIYCFLLNFIFQNKEVCTRKWSVD